MAFQFLCPQGHLLEGDESQVGQQCKCPYCEMEFLVPPPSGETPEQGPAAPGPDAGPESAWSDTPAYPGPHEPVFADAPAGPSPAEEETPGADFPGIVTGHGPGEAGEVPAFGLAAAEQASVVHVICPHGHVLETPRDMLGQDAMCPFCQAEFRLRFEDTEEYRRELEEERIRREQKIGKAWMNWAIAVAVVVVLGVITLVVVAVAD